MVMAGANDFDVTRRLANGEKTRLTYFIQHGRDLSRQEQDRIFAKASFPVLGGRLNVVF